jgi:hypothetical protein
MIMRSTDQFSESFDLSFMSACYCLCRPPVPNVIRIQNVVSDRQPDRGRSRLGADAVSPLFSDSYSRVPFAPRRPAIMTEVCRGFPQASQTSVDVAS